MKISLLFLALLPLLVLSEGDGQHHTRYYKLAGKDVEKQKQILELFYHINQPSPFKEHIDIAKSYSINDNVDNYRKPEVVKQFVQYYKYGFINRGEIFSVFYHDHLDQAIALFNIFYYAKDYETFYKTAIWARQNINEGMFLYAVSVAIIHRPDTYGMVIPPIYEVYPHYFHNTETIHQAYVYKQTYNNQHNDQENKVNQGQNVQGHEGGNDQEHGTYYGYTIASNYSGHYLNLHPEQSLSYYLEDIGINAFYYYYNLYYPFWMCGEEFGMTDDKRGQIFYFVYQQLVARYYMERLANNFGEIPYIDWDVPVETPYYPSLQYPNGFEFPSRPQFANLHEYFYNYGQKWTSNGVYGYSRSLARDFERRINDVVDSGFAFDTEWNKVDIVHNEDSFNKLGNIIEGNHDSVHRDFYGPIHIFARHALGYSWQAFDQHRVAPSALEHFETSMRDPAFYQIYKKIVLKFQRYFSHVAPYTEKDLIFPGVKVTKVEFDPLVTYFEKFYSDLSYAVFDTEHEIKHDTFHARASQYRINHKPFNYKITVKSDKATKASVKVFLGPKYDEYGRYINITENRLNMVEIDHFVYDIKSGENVITRDCGDNPAYGRDRTPYADFYKKVEEAYKGGKECQIDVKDTYFRFPQRYMLPKGSRNGTPYQIYVFVYKYEPYKGKDQKERIGEYYYPKVGSGGVYVDNYPIGYPFDKFIKFEEMWYQIPNGHFQEVRIYHKRADEISSHY